MAQDIAIVATLQNSRREVYYRAPFTPEYRPDLPPFALRPYPEERPQFAGWKAWLDYYAKVLQTWYAQRWGCYPGQVTMAVQLISPRDTGGFSSVAYYSDPSSPPNAYG